MPEQKLTWGQIPLRLTVLVRTYCTGPKLLQLQLANDIMEAVKAELWKCYCDTKCGPDIDFETWYQNTYK